ncbi:hypothetical protein OK016_03400 [Vibrio chagasii]|nr:hypothetical protein [Vibrio chagasii]
MSTILIAIIALAALAAVFGAILGFASIRFKVEGSYRRSNRHHFTANTMWPVWLPRLSPIRGGDC